MAKTTEQRLRDLEQLVGLGLGQDYDAQLKRITAQVAGLTTEKNVGNVLGGMIRTEIAPGLVSIGPYRQDVDSTYFLEFTQWVSDKILRIRELTLHITPKKSRLAAGVAASSGTLTSDASADVINVESAGHVHIWLSKVGTAIITGTTVYAGAATAGPSAATSVADNVHTHNETGGVTSGPSTTINVGTNNHTHAPATTAQAAVAGNFVNYGSFDSAGTADSNRAFDMVPKSGTPTDYYTAISGNSPTSVSTPDHTHDVPGHTHTLTLSISEAGMAAGMHLYIDGVDRTTYFGGPWDAATSIVMKYNDLVTVGLIDARQSPVLGAHVIKITSTASGAIEVVGDMYVVIKAIQ